MSKSGKVLQGGGPKKCYIIYEWPLIRLRGFGCKVRHCDCKVNFFRTLLRNECEIKYLDGRILWKSFFIIAMVV